MGRVGKGIQQRRVEQSELAEAVWIKTLLFKACQVRRRRWIEGGRGCTCGEPETHRRLAWPGSISAVLSPLHRPSTALMRVMELICEHHLEHLGGGRLNVSDPS